eukprot:m.482517 g.482517  ORF g.482517 m.482517 type:complete len:505 (-) comp22559_c0_seq1:161-1675(-)
MDLGSGTRMLATQTYSDDNPAHINFKQGDVLTMLEPKPWQQDWCICQTPSGDKGWALIYFLEPVLTETELEAHHERIRALLPDFVADVPNKGDAIGLIAVSHPSLPAFLHECDCVSALIDFISDDSEPRRGLDSRHPALEGATRALALMCEGAEGEACRDAVFSDKRLLSVVKKRGKNLVNGPIAKLSWLESRSADLLAALFRSERHFVQLCKKEELEDLMVLLSDKTNAVHQLDAYHRATHMPAFAAVVLAAASHESGKQMLRDAGATDLLTAVNATDESPVAYDFVQGALLLLNANSTGTWASARQADEEQSGRHVFISYNWSQQTLAMNVKASLQELGYRVWLDVEKMEGNLIARMAEAVENAASVLILYSHKYAQSPNCLMEADYVSLLQVPFVPVFSEPGCEDIKGPLGILRGRKLYVDFTVGQYDEKVQELIRELGDLGKGAPLEALPKAESKTSVKMDQGPRVLDRLNRMETEMEEMRRELDELRGIVNAKACCKIS